MSETMSLADWGWNPFFEVNFEPFRSRGLSPVRIVRVDRGQCSAVDDRGECVCEISGRFRHETGRKSGAPAVGDWAAVSLRPEAGRAVLHALLPRRSAFSRKAPGRAAEEQIVAANVDVAFIVIGLDANFSVRRAERYLTLAWDSGAVPVVLLNKADLRPDADACRAAVEASAPGTDVHALSAVRPDGLSVLASYLAPGRTAVFLGSSGVGKSTLINALLGTDRQKTAPVSESTDKGRHTTTARELIALPGGGLVIDTPGMRELQVWGDDEGLTRVFPDIDRLAADCRFKDCTHESEPGCAVLDALAGGVLAADRYESYRRLKREFSYQADRATMKASAVEKKRWKRIATEVKRMKKNSTLRD
jgi:ribosome biogenesis GTPase / thiamine phosphate phosphatase